MNNSGGLFNFQIRFKFFYQKSILTIHKNALQNIKELACCGNYIYASYYIEYLKCTLTQFCPNVGF